jgi:large subunit ribosomal protein L20
MTRVKRGSVSRQRRKNVLILAKGAIGSNSTLFRISQQHTIRSLRYACSCRRKRKRQYRSLWVVRLNAAVQLYGWNYSRFCYAIRRNKCLLNRKMLAQLAIFDPIAFKILLTSIL